MEYKLELHIVVDGASHDQLEFLLVQLRRDVEIFAKYHPVEFETAGGLIEKDEAHDEENTEGVPDSE